MKFTEAHRKALSEAKVRFLQSGKFHGIVSRFESNKTGEVNVAHSTSEVKLMQIFDHDDRVKTWSKNHGILIAYEHNGSRTYIPDFLVTLDSGLSLLVEFKGYEFEPEKCKAKAVAAEAYCRERSWTYVIVRQHHLTDRKDWLECQ